MEDRRRLWASKRVFYCTPQILQNDLQNGVVNPKLITCLVVDECHKAQKQYSYVVVVQHLLQIHHHFRVLGLSATPGQDLDSVQGIINNLDINTICLRTRDDPDVRKYLKEVLEEEIVVKLNSRYQRMIDEWMGFVLQPLTRLNNLGVMAERNPRKVNKMILLDLQSRLISGQLGGLNGQRRIDVLNDVKLLMSMLQASTVLSSYGVGAFVEVSSVINCDVDTVCDVPRNYRRTTQSSKDSADIIF